MPRKSVLIRSQPFDNALKTLLQGRAEVVFQSLALSVKVEEELGQEILKPALRADRVYRVCFYGEPAILHTEMETGSNEEMLLRMLEYNSILCRKHRLPVISVVIYPFRTTLPATSLEVKVGPEVITTFCCRIIALWLLRAQDFIDKRDIHSYALLPTMSGATYTLLKQALEEMKKWYGRKRRAFAEQLLLFEIFLERTDVVSREDKGRIVKELKVYNDIMRDSKFVQQLVKEGIELRIEKEKAKIVAKLEAKAKAEVEVKIKAEAEAKVKEAESEAEAKVKEAKEEVKAAKNALVEGIRKLAIDAVHQCCPELAEQVAQKLAGITSPAALQSVVITIVSACGAGEAKVREVIETL